MVPAGRPDEDAILAYEQALARDPARPNGWYNLGILLRRVRRFDEALAAYGRAIEQGIDGAEEAHLQRGVILSDDLARTDDARDELSAALALRPDYVPALLNLGNLHEDVGAVPDAVAAYHRVLAVDPANSLALARLIGLEPDGERLSRSIARAEAALADARLDAGARADLGFALGAAFDRIGQYDRAFAAYRAANAAVAAHAPAYDPVAQDAMADRLIAAFSEPPPAPRAREGTAPIFVCGMFRSGSTLVERMLARHSAMIAGGEIAALPALIAANVSPYPEAVASLSDDRAAAMRAAYLAEVGARQSAGRTLIDKRPDNIFHVGIIKRLFPEACILHTVRDPLDTCLSVWFLHADPAISYAADLEAIAHQVRVRDRLAAHWRRLWPSDILSVDYDRLVTSPREEMARVLEFCGVDWEPAVLDHRVAGGAVRTASNLQVMQPLYTRSSGRWRHYARHLAPIAAAVGVGTPDA